MPRSARGWKIAGRDAGYAPGHDNAIRSLVQAGLGGGYLLLAGAQCLELWEVGRLNQAAPRGTIEASIAGSVLLAVGVVLFVRALPFRRTAADAGMAFRLLAIAGGLVAVGQLAVASAEAKTAIPRTLVLVVVISAAGYVAIAAGWWAWYRAAAEQRRRLSASSRRGWPVRRQLTQVALASGYALFTLADVLTAQRHPHADAAFQLGTLVRAVGFAVAAIGHWQLVAALAWLTTAKAARTGLGLLGIGVGVLAVAPYLAGGVPSAPVSIQAAAYLALAVGWLGWAAAGVGVDERTGARRRT